MSNRVVSSVLFLVAAGFLCAGLIQAQTSKKSDPKKEVVKEDKKDAEKEGEKDADKPAIVPLTAKEMKDMMTEAETAWNRLKIHARNKMGEKSATAADEIAEHAPKLLRYDGKVLKGDNKDQLARDQKDYKDWAAAMETTAKEYARLARKSDWDKAEKEKEKLSATCGDCHAVYQPVKEKK